MTSTSSVSYGLVLPRDDYVDWSRSMATTATPIVLSTSFSGRAYASWALLRGSP